jgi:hypothetical protein
MHSPSLRKFPYPYRAAFAIANDIDNTPSLRMFLEVMKFLNTDSMTTFGKGVNLEVGSSFWFFNATHRSQLSYFRGKSTVDSNFAFFCRALWKSGHLDLLHTYGDFDEGEFKRQFAERSINELEKHGASIKVWINHGNKNNLQNLGRRECQEGADPGSPAYHFDLLKKYGIRFIWSGRMTHVIGQNAIRTYNVRLMNFAQKLLSKTKYRDSAEPVFDFDNRLFVNVILQDASEAWDFVRFVNRYGLEHTQDVHDLMKQTCPSIIGRLISNSGYFILYTHMCEGVSDSNGLPRKLISNFEYLSRMYHDGKLLVTTTSRLLQYNEVHDNMLWQVDNEKGMTKISICPYMNALGVKQRITENMVHGITFYCHDPDKTRIFLDKKPVKVRKNAKDVTGEYSVTIPWRKLKYPYD